MTIPALLVLAQAPTAPAAGGDAGGGLPQTLIFFALIFAVLYFLMIRPQRKKDKERREMLSNIKRGDQVITIGGIHGEVESIDTEFVILLVDRQRGFTLKMSRSAVHNIQTETKVDNKK